MVRLATIALVPCCSLLALCGCGNSRTPVPDFSRPLKPSAFRTLRYSGSTVQPDARRSWTIEFGAPSNWSVVQRKPPVVTVITSGGAVVALWRYHRSAPVPAGAEAFARTRQALVDEARMRDSSLRIVSSRVLMVDNDPAVEVDALESIAGAQRRVRSTHVFVPGAEVVLDAYAPPAVFQTVDHAVFLPLERSLRLSFPPITSG